MILVTGLGRSGSWQIRGVQLGAAAGAVVKPLASAVDCKKARVIVAVKRVTPSLLTAIRSANALFAWDVVDSWPQGHRPDMSEHEAKDWLRQTLHRLKPDAVIWPTRRMQEDAGFKGPQITLPHHAWPRYAPKPLRSRVERVGYEGGAQYLGKWEHAVLASCEARGWEFAVNGDMSGCDIALALRDKGGYPAKHWKSNCKLANIQALGIPALCSPESGYRETASGAELWVETESDLESAFDAVSCVRARQSVRETMLSARIRLDTVADQYRGFLECL